MEEGAAGSRVIPRSPVARRRGRSSGSGWKKIGRRKEMIWAGFGPIRSAPKKKKEIFPFIKYPTNKTFLEK